MILFSCKIAGRVGIKKNSKRILMNRRTGQRFIGSSVKHDSWATIAILSMRRERKVGQPISVPLEASYRFYFKNHQWEPDVSNCVEGVADALQKAQVIVDDKQIIKFTAEKFFGQDARTEVELYAYKGAS